MNPSIKLELSVNEANVVLTGLARLPYEAVFEVIDKIRAQANLQLGPQSVNPSVAPETNNR